MNFSFIKSHYLLILFLVVYFAFSVFTYKDYGATGDEWTERRAAENLLIYLQEPTSYESIMNPAYHDKLGFAFGHHPLVTKYQRSYQLLQTYFNYKGYYEWGHLFNLMFGSTLFIFMYWLFYLHYKSSTKSIVPVIFLVTYARLFGDIPTNNKDVPFAIMYLACVLLIYIFSNQKSSGYLKIILLGIVFGLTQTFRTVGFSVYFVYIIYFFYVEYIEGRKFSVAKIANFFLELFIIAVFSLFISISIFPWLGSNFFANFFNLLLDAKSFQNWDDTVFFAGEFLYKADRPWYYLFTWIFITTPVYILSLLGLFPFFAHKLFKNKLFAISLISLIVNIGLYLAMQPVIYNGIRHFLFILPMIVIVSGVVLFYLFSVIKRRAQIFLGALIFVNILFVGYDLYKLHPYEYIYFNEFIGGLSGASGKYELDYWGASYKEATEWIVKNTDLTQEDIIYACNVDYAVDYYSGKKFFMSYGYPEYANYTICDSENEMKRNYTGKVLYEVKRDGVILNTVREHEKTKF